MGRTGGAGESRTKGGRSAWISRRVLRNAVLQRWEHECLIEEVGPGACCTPGARRLVDALIAEITDGMSSMPSKGGTRAEIASTDKLLRFVRAWIVEAGGLEDIPSTFRVVTCLRRALNDREAVGAFLWRPSRVHEIMDVVMAEVATSISGDLALAAFTDPLTGCGNRRALDRDIPAAIANAVRASKDLTVVVVDLDGLKAINDHRGHAAGDAALRDLALAAQECLRETDHFYRIGGDEFVAVLPFTDYTGAEEVMERVQAAGAPPMSWGTASLATMDNLLGFPVSQGTVDPAALLTAADAELYAKRRRTRGTAASGIGNRPSRVGGEGSDIAATWRPVTPTTKGKDAHPVSRAADGLLAGSAVSEIAMLSGRRQVPKVTRGGFTPSVFVMQDRDEETEAQFGSDDSLHDEEHPHQDEGDEESDAEGAEVVSLDEARPSSSHHRRTAGVAAALIGVAAGAFAIASVLAPGMRSGGGRHEASPASSDLSQVPASGSGGGRHALAGPGGNRLPRSGTAGSSASFPTGGLGGIPTVGIPSGSSTSSGSQGEPKPSHGNGSSGFGSTGSAGSGSTTPSGGLTTLLQGALSYPQGAVTNSSGTLQKVSGLLDQAATTATGTLQQVTGTLDPPALPVDPPVSLAPASAQPTTQPAVTPPVLPVAPPAPPVALPTGSVPTTTTTPPLISMPMSLPTL